MALRVEQGSCRSVVAIVASDSAGSRIFSAPLALLAAERVGSARTFRSDILGPKSIVVL